MYQDKITRMRYERIKKGWSLKYVADYLGITNQAVSKIELLKTHNPSYAILVKLENLFNLSHRDLFETLEVYHNNELKGSRENEKEGYL